MSQIGYMIMGVSVGAYAAGLFHLMTHAFFKALLFMAAGSLIGAMAGEQSLEKLGGFKKAMPFTYGCFIIGGLALSGIPPFSGFFSKDDILLVTGERGGWHWALYAAGYIGALLTAIYTFRMIFRAFHGEPVAEARELEERSRTSRRGPDEPRHRRDRGHRRRLPGPSTRSPSGRSRCASRWASSARGDRHRPDPDPEGRLRDRRLPAPLLRPPRRCTNRTPRTACSSSASCSARFSAARDRYRLPHLGAPPRHRREATRASPPPV